MRNFLVFILLLTVFAPVRAQNRILRYTFSAGKPAATVHVVLETKGTDSGRTVFKLPEHFANEEQLWRAVSNLRVKGGRARLLPVTDPSAWAVQHHPGTDLKISYDLRQDWQDSLEYPHNFRAVIQPGYFQATGYSLLAIPEGPENEKLQVSFGWTGLPKGWAVGNSFHAGSRSYNGIIRRKDLLNSVFVAGDFRLTEQQIGGKPLFTAVRGNNWTFSDAELAGSVKRVIQMERGFWNDHTEPYYFVSLIPFAGRSSANGTNLHQAFMLAMTAEQPIEDWLLAHEYFHRWNGGLIALPSEIEQEHSWFSEGFTEYYTYKLLHDAGILTDSAYKRKANDMIAQYYLSPVRNKDRVTVGKNFWTESYRDFAYKQGFVFALYVDDRIRLASGNRYSLDSVMHGMYRLAKTRDTLTEQDFTAQVSRYLGSGFAPLQARYIDSGGTIPVLPMLLGKPAILKAARLGSFDAGFDIRATIASDEIRGVVEGGPAWKAGLRNGQKTGSYSIERGKVSQPVEMTILDGGKARKITYLPMSNDRVDVPQFR